MFIATRSFARDAVPVSLHASLRVLAHPGGGDLDALRPMLERCLARHGGRLFRAADRRCSRDGADLLQTACLRLLEAYGDRRDKLWAEAEVLCALRRTLQRVAIDAARRRSRRPETAFPTSADGESLDLDLDDHADRPEDSAAVRQCLRLIFQGLSPKVRETLRLLWDDGLTPAEIGARLGVDGNRRAQFAKQQFFIEARRLAAEGDPLAALIVRREDQRAARRGRA